MSLPTLAILAGGLATRQPLAKDRPKALVEVAGEPFLAHQLRLARRQGFRDVVMLVGHLGEQIEAFAGDGSRFGLSVRFVQDGEIRRGTGGALRNALGHLGDVFCVLYGDSYLDIEAAPVWDAFLASGKPALMTVLHNFNQWDKSNVVFDGKLVSRHEKSADDNPPLEWIDYGMSIFSSRLLAQWPQPDPFELSHLTRALAVNGELAGFEVTQRFYEIGTPKGLAETEAWLRAKSASARG